MGDSEHVTLASTGAGTGQGIELPAPTTWPVYFAFGITLLFAGLVTHELVSWVGLAAALAGAAGWWRQVLPHDREESVPLQPEDARPLAAQPRLASVEHLTAGEGSHRMRLPLEVRPLSSGARGAMAGAAAMAVVACAYGLIAHGSIWLPINLLAGALLPAVQEADLEQLRTFHATGLLVAAAMHLVISLLVGVVYAALLPMLPDKPLLWGGLVAPLLWTTVAWSSLWILNPALEQYVNWGWFTASQIAFGLATGMVIARIEPIEVGQSLSLAARAGLEGSGLPRDREKSE